MSVAGYTQFLRNMGHRVVQIDATTWFDAAPRVFMTLPFDREIDPRTFDWKKLFAHGCTAARCLVPPPFGKPSYLMVIENASYDLQHLESKARNQTRRGLEACHVREVRFAELAAEGVALQRDTLARQGRRIPRGLEQYWQRYFRQAGQADGAIAWAAFRGEALAAYLIAFHVADTAHIVIVRSAAAQLRHYPNNAVLFSFVRHMLGSGTVRRVSIGFEPFQTNVDTLDRFKQGLGFERVPVHQYVRLAPPLPTLLCQPVLAGSIACLRVLSRNETANKMAGLLRWYANQRT